MILHRVTARRSGYVLFEVILAVTIFAATVLKLNEALQMGEEAAARMGKENQVRVGLRSFVEETRRKQVSEMGTQSTDDQLGVTYTSTVDPLTIKNQDGTVLVDLYVLHAKAVWGEGNDAQDESVDLYLYEPSGQNINNPADGSSATSSTSGSTSGSTTSGAAPSK